jgi:nucleotide-binding universal stress UspA family protein
MSIFPTKILLATDASREAEFAGQTAADLAQKTDSELHVVHVLASPLATHDPSSEHVGWYASQSDFEPEVWLRLEQRERKTLEDVVAKIEASGGKVEGSHHTAGRPDAEIVALAEELGAGLVVMGARGVGRIRRALTGSVSESVVRHAHCTVMVVREE